MTHPMETFLYCPRCGAAGVTPHDERSCRCRQCGFLFYANCATAVAAVITDKDGRILLCTRACEPQKGMLDLPGGFVEFDETAEAALRRELAEELGIKVHDVRYLFSQPNRYTYSGYTVHTLDMFFRVEAGEIGHIRCSDDVSRAEFIAPGEIDFSRIGFWSMKAALHKVIDENLL